MSQVVRSEMLRRLKMRKGCTFEELIARMPVPDIYRNTDVFPRDLLFRNLTKLVELGLVEAFNKDGRIDKGTSTRGRKSLTRYGLMFDK